MKTWTEEQREAQRLLCRKWYYDHRKERIAQVSQYNKTRVKQCRENGRRSYHNRMRDPEARTKTTAMRKAWRDANRERSNKLNRDWARANRPLRRALEAKRRLLETAASANLKAIKKWMKRVLRSSNATCYYCKSVVPRNRVHFDHIVALSKGGNHSPENLCASCAPCNQSKSARSISAWVKVGQQILEL